MKKHGKKMIAPIVISALVVIYYGFYFGLLISLVDGAAGYLLGIVSLVLAAVMIRTCAERIKEIKEGEEDDIGKY